MAKVALGIGPLPTVHQEGKAVAAKASVPKPTDRGTGAKHALSLIAGEGAKQLLCYTIGLLAEREKRGGVYME